MFPSIRSNISKNNLSNRQRHSSLLFRSRDFSGRKKKKPLPPPFSSLSCSIYSVYYRLTNISPFFSPLPLLLKQIFSRFKLFFIASLSLSPSLATSTFAQFPYEAYKSFRHNSSFHFTITRRFSFRSQQLEAISAIRIYVFSFFPFSYFPQASDAIYIAPRALCSSALVQLSRGKLFTMIPFRNR